MYTLGLDTIEGSKLLQVKFGRSSLFQPDQAVLHGDRRARFVGMRGGVAIIRHCGDSHTLAVPLETLALPPDEAAPAVPRAQRSASETTWRTRARRSSGSVANWSLSRTTRRRLTIV
jgi:hypothetical protein